jgi:hypothetical protein
MRKDISTPHETYKLETDRKTPVAISYNQVVHQIVYKIDERFVNASHEEPWIRVHVADLVHLSR